jgi:hypothetical protein
MGSLVLSKRQAIAVLAVVSAVAIGSGGAADGGRASRASVSAGFVAAPSQIPIARNLIARLATAPSPAVRLERLVDIARALNIGVYRGDGRPLNRGAERRALDFYYYDFELRVVGSALARKQLVGATPVTNSINDLVSVLNEQSTSPPLTPVTDSQLAAALTAATRASLAQPRDPKSLLPLIVRELGLRQKPAYDLARAVPADRLRFDALQRSLILADSTGVVLAALAKPAGRKLATADAPDRARACNFANGKGLGRFGKFILTACIS